MKNRNRKPQRQKEYGRGDKNNYNKKSENKNNRKDDKKNNKKEINIIDEEILFEKSKNILENNNKIYLLNLKVGAIKDNKKIYAVIFKKKESVSHVHCIEATRVIQNIIKSEGYDEGDYSITVSSAGFRWQFEDRYELFEDMPIKIRHKNENNEIITEKGILKEAKEDYIILENDKIIKILKKDIIKTRLNC